MDKVKLHKLEVYVLDLNHVGINNLILDLEQNDDFSVHIIDMETCAIHNWDDDHELNQTRAKPATFRKYFHK